jgi:hypothetical protein
MKSPLMGSGYQLRYALEDITERLFTVLLMSAVSLLAFAQAGIFYYVDIDNAPNGTANGTCVMYHYGEPTPVRISTLTFLENYTDGMGGKYRSTEELPKSTPSSWITIKCTARKPWPPNDWLYGFCEQTFTGGSGVYLPTIHIEDPPTPPNPPDPK